MAGQYGELHAGRRVPDACCFVHGCGNDTSPVGRKRSVIDGSAVSRHPSNLGVRGRVENAHSVVVTYQRNATAVGGKLSMIHKTAVAGQQSELRAGGSVPDA